MPKVTVLIPAHNAERSLAETLESLVGQTYRDFEVILVDDASSDQTASIAGNFATRLPLRVLTLQRNLGVAGALNKGVEATTAEFIARIDADDIASPDRLEKQVLFLETHLDIDVCGTAMEVFSDPLISSPWTLTKPLENAAIKTSLIQSNALSHPSTIIRRSFFSDVGNYDVRADFAEDYDLWCRGALLGKNYANLSDVLVRYRQHDGQVSQQKRKLQLERDLVVKRKYISGLLSGRAPGYLAEFFSQEIGFTSRETAKMVVRQSIPLLFQLAAGVDDKELFHEMVSGCILRHLN